MNIVTMDYIGFNKFSSTNNNRIRFLDVDKDNYKRTYCQKYRQKDKLTNCVLKKILLFSLQHVKHGV